MAVSPDTTFTRQSVASKEEIGVVVPANAEMLPSISRQLDAAIREGLVPESVKTRSGTSFHYLPVPFNNELLDNGARINTGVYEFAVRDSVIEVFDLVSFGFAEFCWAFSATTQLNVVAALKIGETLDVRFESPLQQAFHVSKYQFPPPLPDSGYGQYPVHVSIDGLSAEGFRVVSSYEPASKRTNSRLPFLFGFQVFGIGSTDQSFPVWRELLAEAVRQAMWRNWGLALMYAAFSLESLVDLLMSHRLRRADVGDAYIDHVLRVADRKHELHALNDGGRITVKEVNREYEQLNKRLFSPRNRLVHGRQVISSIEAEDAVAAIKTAVAFAWDWSHSARPYLLARMRPFDRSRLVDAELISACQAELATV